MDLPCTLADLIAAHPVDRVALDAPGRPSLTFGALGKLADETVSSLNAFGIGRNDRVALVLPNGPEMAAAFLAVGAGATVAPLNPAYREDEFHFYLDDLSARALIVSEEEDGPAVDAAARLGMPVLRLVGDTERPAGSFSLLAEGTGGGNTPVKGYAGAADTALVLHTSGTTSRPKIVPLTQANICASAEHIVQTLRLEPADRGMNIMPLFHIHGLIANLLAPMRAGTSVYCTPGFDAFRVFEWFADAEPTWYSAVPTMHQAILARARRNTGITDALQLRFCALVLIVPAAAGDAGTGNPVPLPGDRELRHDRGGAPDGEQPPAACGAPRGVCRHCGRTRDRRHGRGGPCSAHRRDRRGGHPGPERHGRIREQPGSQ